MYVRESNVESRRPHSLRALRGTTADRSSPAPVASIACSISRSVAGDSCTCAAGSHPSICCGDLAPRMAPVTPETESVHATESAERSRSSPVGDLPQSLDQRQIPAQARLVEVR